MERASSAIRWRLFVIPAFLGLLSGAASWAADCRNSIPSLGGSTAIYRGKPLETVAKLHEALKSKKTLKAFEETLEAAGLGSRRQEIMNIIDRMADSDKKSYDPGTLLEWMAYRDKADHRVKLLRHSCWGGAKPFWAWELKLPQGDGIVTYLIPVDCLNLALPWTPPPSKKRIGCDLRAKIDCSTSPAKVTLIATPQIPDLTEVQKVVFSGPPQKVVNQSPYIVSYDVSDSGSYSAQVFNLDGLEGPSCKVEVAVCVRTTTTPKQCANPPSCQLNAAGSWSEARGSGSLYIDIDGSTGTQFRVEITGPEFATPIVIEKFNSSENIDQKITKAGEYSVKVTATAADESCKVAVCSTVVKAERPTPCCEKPWFLRTYAGFVESQGSKQRGAIQTPDGSGIFQFGFNEGLGFGVELERRFAHQSQPWNEGRWGWTFGLFRADLNTIWQLDTHDHWIRDKDRVPMLTVTTGLDYHWHGTKWDFHAGPVVGYAHFEDGTYADLSTKPETFRAQFEDRFVYGAKAGFDSFIGRCWGITGGLEYLKIPARADFLKVDVDPLIVKAGFVYHF